MRILFVSSEMSPLAKTGGLGDVVGSLPKALRALGHDCRVVIPLYRPIKDWYYNQMTFLRWSMIKLGWRTMYSGLFTMDVEGVPVYLIDNEFYFGSDRLYVDYSFDIERFSFFQRAVLEALGEPMQFEPQILNLNDWQTAMIPALLEAHYKPHGYHQQVYSTFTIHNLKYQGIHGRERIQDLLELDDSFMTEETVLKDGAPNFMKAGIVYSNRVNTVSPSYADEILMDYYGEGLNSVLYGRKWKLTGILNGIDTAVYNPEKDPLIETNYSLKDWKTGKASCKRAVQREFNLPQDEKKPLAILISRLVNQKGIDLLLYILDELLNQDMQLIVLGSGEERYEQAIQQAADRHPDKMRCWIGFDEALSHRLYAAADLFLMPSIFEPCGLSQMIAQRYGCLPIVRETGGLRDTVQPYNQYDGTGNGFSFANINAHELLYTTQYALRVYNEPEAWDHLVESAMKENRSWVSSAQRYLGLYQDILRENHVPESEWNQRELPVTATEELWVEQPAEPVAEMIPSKQEGASEKDQTGSADEPNQLPEVPKKPAGKGAASKKAGSSKTTKTAKTTRSQGVKAKKETTAVPQPLAAEVSEQREESPVSEADQKPEKTTKTRTCARTTKATASASIKPSGKSAAPKKTATTAKKPEKLSVEAEKKESASAEKPKRKTSAKATE